MSARPPAALRGYRYEWQLFADWCAASDIEPLPTSAINNRHRGAGLPEPGRVTAIRLALDCARSTRVRRLSAQFGGPGYRVAGDRVDGGIVRAPRRSPVAASGCRYVVHRDRRPRPGRHRSSGREPVDRRAPSTPDPINP
ncbi:hypothetical protein [Rhodococcus sp. H29-C3]|uniref:hypothetical protein n=1 Tax=Rhodococcus sp. H29-C3 TaxID=3046307 RepID=UPI0024B8B4AE|nr:hypothetical protein [Rhodococcus sp. H29-C3]MDJ0362304.1 hypothetical protein [Rhodococcus sp. H29-C3]